MEVNLMRLFEIEELSREICYGGSITPLGYFTDSNNILVIMKYINKDVKGFIIDSNLVDILDRIPVRFSYRISELLQMPNFSSDIVIVA